MAFNANIKVEVIDEYSDHEDWGIKNLRDAKTYEHFMLAFGNGLIEQARVVGETKAGIFAFTNLIMRGGYRRYVSPAVPTAKLYRQGDICYPSTTPFIFISPVAENGDRIDFDRYEEELDAFLQSEQ